MLAICTLSHILSDKTDPERGFSVNKYLLAIYSASTSEKTNEAIRLVKDYVILNVAEDNVPTRALLKKCTESRQMELLKR